jgi:hypothetical protein
VILIGISAAIPNLKIDELDSTMNQPNDPLHGPPTEIDHQRHHQQLEMPRHLGRLTFELSRSGQPE